MTCNWDRKSCIYKFYLWLFNKIRHYFDFLNDTLLHNVLRKIENFYICNTTIVFYESGED